MERRLVIECGDVFWLRFRGRGSAPAGRRPAVVVQHDRFNRSAISTAVVAAITSNLRMAEMPGNVRLRRGEAGLPKASVVNVTQLATVDKAQLEEKLGALSSNRLEQVRDGLALVLGLD